MPASHLRQPTRPRLQPLPDQIAPEIDADAVPARPPCPAPAVIRAEVAHYDRHAQVGHWGGPRYRMTYRILGEGPPLIVVPGIASTYRSYALLLNRLAERFRTIIYDYPGDQPDDGARLAGIKHDHLVDDVFGLVDHLAIGRVFLTGLSFGSTIVLKGLRREPRRFPRAAVQGAFACRDFSPGERWALRLGRLVPGNVARLPFRRPILTYNSKAEFPSLMEDRWTFYLEENGLTRIRSLAHRVALLIDLDLRPVLGEIPTEVLLIQGNEDRIVARRYFEMLQAALPRAEGAIMPTVGHQPHLTHVEALASLIGNWLLPCAPGGCSEEQQARAGCTTPSSAPGD
jgi:pimeloyl-ACP methyl ester carboxylesterase